MFRRLRSTLGITAATAAMIAGGVVAAAPAHASTCPPKYYLCYQIYPGNQWGDMDVYKGSDGHDHIDADGHTYDNKGMNLWVLTWNGSGWDWKGFPMNQGDGFGPNGWYAEDLGIWDGNGTLVKIAIWDDIANQYVYSPAH